MRRPALVLALGVVCASAVFAQRTASSKPLEIYVVDVEGGKADLWVMPSGQTVLVDAGSPGGRDPGRIQEVMAAAGVTKLDYLISTHYHVDHVGGVQELVTHVPVTTFVDHGRTAEDGAEGHQQEQVRGFQAAYAEIYGKAKHIVVKPGDKLPIAGLDWSIVTAGGKTLSPGASARPNPACANEQRVAAVRDPENAQSVGSLITFGQLRLLDLGDLTQDAEYDLMCPRNPIGNIDVFFASNHGLAGGANTPALIHAIQPRVVIVQNSAGKGASLDMWKAIETSPGIEDTWLLHWGNAGGAEHNPAGIFIANGVDAPTIAAALTAPPRAGGGRPAGGAPAPAANTPAAATPRNDSASSTTGTPTPTMAGGGPPASAPPDGSQRTGGRGGFGGATAAHSPAYWLKIAVQPDGTFTVTNTRNNFSKTYARRPRS